MNLEIQQLRYFIAVAEELSFASAARRLHISPSPLSQQIRALEARVGQRLFDRNSRSVQLTEAGEYLLPGARRLVEDADGLVADLRSFGAVAAGPLRLGYSGNLGGRVYSQLLRRLLDQHPMIQPVIRELTGVGDQFAALSRSEVDIVLTHHPAAVALADDLDRLVLGAASILAIVRDDSEYAAAGSVALAELAGRSLVTTDVTPNHPFVRYMNSLIEGTGARLVPTRSAGGYGGLMDMVLAGLGTGFSVSGDQRLLRPGIRTVPIIDPVPRLEILVAWRRAEHRPAVLVAKATIAELHAEHAFDLLGDAD